MSDAKPPVNDAREDSRSGSIAWHALSPDETLQRLDVDPDTGLYDERIAARLAEHGANELEEGRRRTVARMLLGQFTDFISFLREIPRPSGRGGITGTPWACFLVSAYKALC